MKNDESLLRSLSSVLDNALLELKEKDRQPLLLRFFEDKSLHEVGETLGISDDAAQKRVAKALVLSSCTACFLNSRSWLGRFGLSVEDMSRFLFLSFSPLSILSGEAQSLSTSFARQNYVCRNQHIKIASRIFAL